MAISIKEGVKGVEKLLLGAILTREELHVVDQKTIGLTKATAKFDQFPMLDRRNELIGELFRGHVNDFSALFLLHDPMSNRMEQVGLPKADRAVNEKRIVGAGRCVSHCGGGGVGKLTVHPCDKGLEGVATNQLSR